MRVSLNELFMRYSTTGSDPCASGHFVLFYDPNSENLIAYAVDLQDNGNSIIISGETTNGNKTISKIHDAEGQCVLIRPRLLSFQVEVDLGQSGLVDTAVSLPGSEISVIDGLIHGLLHSVVSENKAAPQGKLLMTRTSRFICLPLRNVGVWSRDNQVLYRFEDLALAQFQTDMSGIDLLGDSSTNNAASLEGSDGDDVLTSTLYESKNEATSNINYQLCIPAVGALICAAVARTVSKRNTTAHEKGKRQDGKLNLTRNPTNRGSIFLTDVRRQNAYDDLRRTATEADIDKKRDFALWMLS